MKYLIVIMLLFIQINLFSQEDYTKVDNYVKNYDKNVKDIDGLYNLLDNIKNKFDTDLEKIRAIHIWLVLNITYDDVKMDAKFDKEYIQIYGSNKIQEINYVIKTKKGICNDFATLFVFMGEYLDQEVDIISGFARDYQMGHNEITNEIETGEGHAWNYVNLNGSNYFVDVTWSLYDSAQNYNTYFLVPPYKMITTHYPIDVENQYLDKPISSSEYLNFPFVNDFYKYNYSLLDFIPKKNIIDEKRGKLIRFGIKVSKRIKKECIIILKNGNKELKKTNGKNHKDFLILEFYLEKENEIEDLQIFIKLNDHDEEMLISYEVLK